MKMTDNDTENTVELQTGAEDDSPKFGRLLVVLLLAVMLIVAITLATEAYYSN